MALAGVGWLALQQGDHDRVQEACEEGLELLAHEEAKGGQTTPPRMLRVGGVQEGRSRVGKGVFEESLALSREMSDSWWAAISLSNLALVSDARGDSERATELFEESMDLFRRAGRHVSLLRVH